MVVDAYFSTQKELDSTQNLHARPKVPKKRKKHKTKQNDHSIERMQTEQGPRNDLSSSDESQRKQYMLTQGSDRGIKLKSRLDKSNNDFATDEEQNSFHGSGKGGILRSDRLDKMINIKQDYFENYNIEKENSKDLKGQSSIFKFLPQKSRYDFSSNLKGQNPTNDLSMTSVGQNLRAIQDERTRQRYRAEVSGKRQYTNTLQGNLTNNIQSDIYS